MYFDETVARTMRHMSRVVNLLQDMSAAVPAAATTIRTPPKAPTPSRDPSGRNESTSLRRGALN